MQFVENGPDVPDELLFAHEEGRVVFFCGAGISYPAGLPGFGGLVDKIYRTLGTSPADIEQRALERDQFDACLDLLERRVPGGRYVVRTAIAKALVPNLRKKGATQTHAALLSLGRTRGGATRIVTTNFDRIFQHVISRSRLAVSTYSGPTLPIPKNSRWDGVVHLHGILERELSETALNRLVVTSGDFGLAYLTERWASRFVSDLFKNYVVCFVGYSLNDPVLRYMMDALAADRMLGEETPQAYAFGEVTSGDEDNKRVEWEAKGVSPVLYEVPHGTHDHGALHRTLKAWAETHRDGVQGRERIVASNALTKPQGSTRQDDFVGRMLWALSDGTGLPAKRFADFDPVPSLDWIQPLSDNRYGHADLPRFGVSPNKELDSKLHFSLVRRPASYAHAPWMAFVSHEPEASRWDAAMFHLGRWLTRHLGDPDLLLWLANAGGCLHHRLAYQIGAALNELTAAEHRDMAELERLRKNAPNCLPDEKLKVLWHLFLAGRVRTGRLDFGFHDWRESFGIFRSSRLRRATLRDLLRPEITISKAIRWPESDTDNPRATDSLEVEVVLASDSAATVIEDLKRLPDWSEFLSSSIEDLQILLRDALDLFRDIGKAYDDEDRSHWDMPSIEPHWQNRGFQDWVLLIELLRDAWLSVNARDRLRAGELAERWMLQGYPTFKRLGLFAAGRGAVPAAAWVSWLTTDRWLLWSPGSQREVMRVIVLRGRRLPHESRDTLEAAILEGPPREKFRDELSPQDWGRLCDRAIWLRLAKLGSSGSALSRRGRRALRDLEKRYPLWSLSADERDEFSSWMSGTGDPDYEDRRIIDEAPRRKMELVNWLQQPKKTDFFSEDTWGQTCEERFFVCVTALSELADRGIWPIERWREALQTWSGEKHRKRSWRFLPNLLLRMPDSGFREAVPSIAWWLDSAADVPLAEEAAFFDLCRRVLSYSTRDEVPDSDRLSKAINHPVGQTVSAIIKLVLSKNPSDNDELPGEPKIILTSVCHGDDPALLYGRVVIASRIITLYRLDPEWTDTIVLPLFEWDNDPTTAAAMWDGFLWSPRIYRPLFERLKISFLKTAENFSQLSVQKSQYPSLFAYVGLDYADIFEGEELRRAISALPTDALEGVARSLVQALDSAADQREEYFKNRVVLFLREVWPKSRDRMSDAMSGNFARLAIAAGGEFPLALELVRGWLLPLEQPSLVIMRLAESGLCRRYPAESLLLLSLVVGNTIWVTKDLVKCLDEIRQSWSLAESDPEFQRLQIKSQG